MYCVSFLSLLSDFGALFHFFFFHDLKLWQKCIDMSCYYHLRITHLYTKHQVAVSVLHLPLSALELLGSLLLPL